MAHNLQIDRINAHVFTNRVPVLNSTRNFSQDHQTHRNQTTKFRMTQRIVSQTNNKKIKSEALSPETTRPTYNAKTKPVFEGNALKKSYTVQKDQIPQKLSDIINMKNMKISIQSAGRAAALGNHSPEKTKIKTNGLMIDNVSTSVQKFNNQTKYVIHKNRKYSYESEQKHRASVKIIETKSQFTSFEQQQIKKYQVYYRGNRRIFQKSDFTDSEGNSLVQFNDSIAYRYQVLQQLGRGAFGKVYRVQDHKKNEQVALKIIRSIPKLNKQSKIQIQILQNVIKNDPQCKTNIVRIKGSFVFRGHTCITYEMLSMNLYEYLKLNKFKETPNHILTKFAIQILHSLNYLHNQKIVHCDMKPQNIMLKQPHKTGVRLIDLGSSCYEDQQYYTYIQSRFYRAPEVILGIKYSPMIDIWSFGCVLAELHTGYPLFPGENQDEQLMMYIELLGYPPNSMIEEGIRRKRFFNDNFQCRIVQPAQKYRIPKGMSFQRALQHCPNKNFVQFIKRCICWEPNKRITPKEALLHDWILDSIPANIKARHIVQVTGEGFHF